MLTSHLRKSPFAHPQATWLEIAPLRLYCLWPSVSSGKKFRWCTLSDLEQRKCAELSKVLLAVLPLATINSFARVSCVRAHNTQDCIDKIRVSAWGIPEFI